VIFIERLLLTAEKKNSSFRYFCPQDADGETSVYKDTDDRKTTAPKCSTIPTKQNVEIDIPGGSSRI
jgi:hypothetical protein